MFCNISAASCGCVIWISLFTIMFLVINIYLLLKYHKIKNLHNILERAVYNFLWIQQRPKPTKWNYKVHWQTKHTHCMNSLNPFFLHTWNPRQIIKYSIIFFRWSYLSHVTANGWTGCHLLCIVSGRNHQVAEYTTFYKRAWALGVT